MLTKSTKEDHTNLHRHAKHNAQEAIALAKQRAQQFDAQAALERKTNQALQLAKAQAHIRDESEERGDGASGSNKTPLVDRKLAFLSHILPLFRILIFVIWQSIRTNLISRTRHLSAAL